MSNDDWYQDYFSPWMVIAFSTVMVALRIYVTLHFIVKYW